MSIKELGLWVLGFLIAYAIIGKWMWVGVGVLALLWLIRLIADLYYWGLDNGKFQ